MSDVMRSIWALALALDFDDPNEVEVCPVTEEDDGSAVWRASMQRFDETEHDEPYLFAKGPSPEAALGELASQLMIMADVRREKLTEALAFFDDVCEWDELRVVLNRKKRT